MADEPQEQQQEQAAPAAAAPEFNPEGNFFTTIAGKFDENGDPAPEKAPEVATEPEEKQAPDTEPEAKPEQKPEEKAAPEAEEETKLPGNVSKAASKAFAARGAEIKTLKQERDELKRQLQERDTAQADYVPKSEVARIEQELEAKRQELESLNDTIWLVKREKHPTFVNEISKPLDDIRNTVTSLAEKSGLKASDLLNAVADSDGTKLDQLVADLPERVRTKLYSLQEQYDSVTKRRDELLASAKDDLARIEEEDRVASERAYEEQRNARINEIKQNVGILKEKFGKYAVTEADKDTLEKALGFGLEDKLWERPARVQAAAVVALSMSPVMDRLLTEKETQLQAAQREIATLNSKLKSYQKSDPGAGLQGSPKPKESTNSIPEGASLMEALTQRIGA